MFKPKVNPILLVGEVRKELESLELLLKLQDASEILKSSHSSSMALSQISQVLCLAKMEPGKNF
jgi:poly [ADP-ribose] polymerase